MRGLSVHSVTFRLRLFPFYASILHYILGTRLCTVYTQASYSTNVIIAEVCKHTTTRTIRQMFRSKTIARVSVCVSDCQCAKIWRGALVKCIIVPRNSACQQICLQLEPNPTLQFIPHGISYLRSWNSARYTTVTCPVSVYLSPSLFLFLAIR